MCYINWCQATNVRSNILSERTWKICILKWVLRMQVTTKIVHTFCLVWGCANVVNWYTNNIVIYYMYFSIQIIKKEYQLLKTNRIDFTIVLSMFSFHKYKQILKHKKENLCWCISLLMNTRHSIQSFSFPFKKN